MGAFTPPLGWEYRGLHTIGPEISEAFTSSGADVAEFTPPGQGYWGIHRGGGVFTPSEWGHWGIYTIGVGGSLEGIHTIGEGTLGLFAPSGWDIGGVYTIAVGISGAFTPPLGGDPEDIHPSLNSPSALPTCSLSFTVSPSGS